MSKSCSGEETFRTGIGQDSHRFLTSKQAKPLILGGILFEGLPGLSADSDGDVILHSICNAITSLTHVPILGQVAKDLCLKDGITDSAVYLGKALETLGDWQIEHVALSLEAKRPFLQPRIRAVREKIAELLGLKKEQVGLTATSGDGLTDFGCGKGIQCFCLLTVKRFQGVQ
ncbi:MAG: 2-C-methyl-D-erythritol 2,4-cyclodiphosphate synthase [Parachlamydiales bacterium]|jgi:2-C-methyl-D-erythritol 2,4-cyclodiphosphate synthase